MSDVDPGIPTAEQLWPGHNHRPSVLRWRALGFYKGRKIGTYLEAGHVLREIGLVTHILIEDGDRVFAVQPNEEYDVGVPDDVIRKLRIIEANALVKAGYRRAQIECESASVQWKKAVEAVAQETKDQFEFTVDRRVPFRANDDRGVLVHAVMHDPDERLLVSTVYPGRGVSDLSEQR